MPHCATSRCCHASRSDVFAPAHLGELTGVVPPEMVDAALEAGGGRERRLRRLPSRVIVYLLLAGALFVGHGWSYVFSRLTAKDDGRVRTPARSALSGAMRPVGPRPLRELFHLLAGPGTAGTGRRTRFAGRLVVALDGTRVPIADTERNRMVLPEPRGGPNGQAGYPMVRLVALIATGTRSMIDAVFGTDRVGELSYADTLLGALRSPMLLPADRNFAAHRIFDRVAAAGADFLIRARTGRRAMKLAPVKRLPDGSWLARVRGRLVRVVDATIRVTTRTSTSTSEYRLITTLLDPATAPAERLVGLYHDRWEIETAYCELKSTILDATAARPAPVRRGAGALGACGDIPGGAHRDVRRDPPPTRHRPRSTLVHHRTAHRPRPDRSGRRGHRPHHSGPHRPDRNRAPGRSPPRTTHPHPTTRDQASNLQAPGQEPRRGQAHPPRDTPHPNPPTSTQPLTERHWG